MQNAQRAFPALCTAGQLVSTHAEETSGHTDGDHITVAMMGNVVPDFTPGN